MYVYIYIYIYNININSYININIYLSIYLYILTYICIYRLSVFMGLGWRRSGGWLRAPCGEALPILGVACLTGTFFVLLCLFHALSLTGSS